MTSKELVAVGAPSTEENAPPSANDPVAETVRDSGSCEDGEIRSENKSGGDEDLSNVEVDLNELVAAKVTCYPPAFVSATRRLRPKLLKNMKMQDFSLLVMYTLLPVKRYLPLKPMKSLFSGIFYLWI
jgi:hypothetical protein